jgi:hypothetical protein
VKKYLLVVPVLSLGKLACGSDNSIEVTLEGREDRVLTDAELARFKQVADEFGLKFKAACDRGKAAAEQEIKAGLFRLRACGEPAKKPEIDSETGYRIERIVPCGQRNVYFDAEVTVYNRTMREWNAKHRRRQRSDQAMQPTADCRTDSVHITKTSPVFFTLALALDAVSPRCAMHSISLLDRGD